MSDPVASPVIVWREKGGERSARWQSEAEVAPPKRVVIADDTMKADRAYRLACEGTALLWRGDFQNARQLLQALMRRVDERPRRKAGGTETPALSEQFHLHRMAQAQRVRTLGMLLLQVEPGHQIGLRRAPDVAAACTEAHGPAHDSYVLSLRELLGLIGAHEWRRRGVEIAALKERIHPHYGVFSPVRGEYIDLVYKAPLPDTAMAFDIGTGTGVLAAVLAQRGVKKVLATDQDARALTCARDNLTRLGLTSRVEVIEADLFPAMAGQAGLIVCNPPWVPARPSAPLERSVYDFESRMLRGFLQGVRSHLAPGGEAWLILSDLAEHLGLRTRDQLLGWIAEGGLSVKGRLDARPTHAKVRDASDPLHAARRAEVTSLWRLVAA